MTKVEDVKRLDEIVDGASKLPIENQEYILTTIRGMLFTRNLLQRQEQPRKPPKKPAWGSSRRREMGRNESENTWKLDEPINFEWIWKSKIKDT